jgi:hypothetical protein
MKRFSTAALVLFVLTPLLACQEDLEDISQVTKLRVLAVQATLPELSPGENTQLRVLTADPAGNGRRITAAGFAIPGLLTPSSSEIDDDLPFPPWALEPTAAVDGVIEFNSLGVPVDAGDHYPPDETSLKVTAVILICAGDGFDEFALLGQLGQMSMGGETDLGESLDLSALCVQAGADEGLTALKTFTISDRTAEDPLRNTNPEIDRLYFVGEGDDGFEVGDEETLLLPAIEGGHGVFQCTSSDGCRKGVEMQAFMTEASFQQLEQIEFGQSKIVDERMYVSWFVDGGKMSADRSGSNDPLGPYDVKWIPPREGGAYTLWAVAHDIRGGVSWTIYSVEAIPPP